MATLAVFAQAPNTLAGAQDELSAWPGARWHRNTAHKHVPTLVKERLLRLVALGRVPALNQYEITPVGEERRLRWLRSHAMGPAAVERDTALAKIKLCKNLGDVAAVVKTLEAEQAMYERAFGEAHGRSIAAKRARRRDPGRPSDLKVWLDGISIDVEAAFWDTTAKHLHFARRELETMLGESPGEADE